jgi:hypothetical protein
MLQQQHTSHGSSMLSGGGAGGAMHSSSSSQTTGYHPVASMSQSGGTVAANAGINAAAAAAAGLPSQSLSGVVDFSPSLGGGMAAQQQHGGMEVPLQLQPMGIQVGCAARECENIICVHGCWNWSFKSLHVDATGYNRIPLLEACSSCTLAHMLSVASFPLHAYRCSPISAASMALPRPVCSATTQHLWPLPAVHTLSHAQPHYCNLYTTPNFFTCHFT